MDQSYFEHNRAIQSETQTIYPEKQARMSIFALFTDSLICTISILILLVTGMWEVKGLQPSEYVVSALKLYLPNVEYFMAVLFVFAGFTTITGYLVVGQKCAKYLLCENSYEKNVARELLNICADKMIFRGTV